MCGVLSVQRVLSGELANRRFLLRPPEPSANLLLSAPSKSIYVGKTKFLHAPFFWDPEKLVNPHICVVGITGSGKSYFVKAFITRASISLGCGALVLDWAGEYADFVESAGGKVVRFGDGGINLMETAGASPRARIAQVMSSLELLTDISAFPCEKLATIGAMEKAYLLGGYSLSSNSTRKNAPTLLNVISLLSKGKASREAARRLQNLLSSSGKSFCSHSINLDSLVPRGLVCVDLHSLPTEALRSLAGLALLQFVKEKMRASECSSHKMPRLFVVVDEAWKIAADERSDVISIVREGRKYGFSLIVASQNPTDVHRSIFSNAGTVACFRLTLSSERDYVRSSLGYSEFFERESHSLSVGQALFHLEFSSQVPCPKTFVISKVEGEDLLSHLRIRGGPMDLVFEKTELVRQLLSFGLSDRQSSFIVSEFERRNNSLSAGEMLLLLERLGHSRASSLTLLRELGASERGLIAAFSSAQKGVAGVPVALSGSRSPPAKERGRAQECGGTARRGQGKSRRKAAAPRNARILRAFTPKKRTSTHGKHKPGVAYGR